MGCAGHGMCILTCTYVRAGLKRTYTCMGWLCDVLGTHVATHVVHARTCDACVGHTYNLCVKHIQHVCNC